MANIIKPCKAQTKFCGTPTVQYSEEKLNVWISCSCGATGSFGKDVSEAITYWNNIMDTK
jgi:hypothetical protein